MSMERRLSQLLHDFWVVSKASGWFEVFSCFCLTLRLQLYPITSPQPPNFFTVTGESDRCCSCTGCLWWNGAPWLCSHFRISLSFSGESLHHSWSRFFMLLDKTLEQLWGKKKLMDFYCILLGIIQRSNIMRNFCWNINLSIFPHKAGDFRAGMHVAHSTLAAGSLEMPVCLTACSHIGNQVNIGRTCDVCTPRGRGGTQSPKAGVVRPTCFPLSHHPAQKRIYLHAKQAFLTNVETSWY